MPASDNERTPPTAEQIADQVRRDFPQKGMIQPRITCKACGLDRAPFLVRERRGDEDIVQWMRTVVQTGAGYAHGIFSPACKSEVCDLWLPAPGSLDGTPGPIGIRPKGVNT